MGGKNQMGRPLGNAFGSKLPSRSVFSRRRGVNFRREVNANISETPVGFRQRRNTLQKPDADVLQLQQRKTTMHECSSIARCGI